MPDNYFYQMKNHSVTILVLTFAFFFGGFYANAQQARVLNEASEFPIEGVVIFNKKQNHSLITDKDGYFDLNIFNSGDTLYFKHISFNTAVFTIGQIKEMKYQVFLVPNVFLMEEFKVIGNIRENPDELPYRLKIIKPEALKNATMKTSADILRETGAVFVQKSQGGGGSPVLRGYEANKILLVVDGVRMNNAIYRNGHLQNSITIGQSMLERVELVFGPGSIAYGSDALGGVVHYHTTKPQFSHQKKNELKLEAGLQYATANKSTVGNMSLNFGKKHFASLTAFQISNYGDIRIGENRKFTAGDEQWALTPYYVCQNSLGKDSMIKNPDPEIQINTAYEQWDFLQKFRIKVNNKIDWDFNFQYSNSSNVPRYDQLNDYKDGILKYAQWDYGPQKRLLASTSGFFKYDNRWFTNLRATFAYQNIGEERITRKFGNANQLNQNEKVAVWSLNFDFLKLIGINRLTYGLEFTHNNVLSTAYYQNIFSGAHSIAQTRYPDGGSIMQSASAYVDYKWIIRDRFIITGGFRYSFYHLYSEFLNLPGLVQLPFNEIKINNGAPVGIISFEFYPATEWKIRSVLSSGFRSPNVDDYGKIRAKSEKVTVPNENLKPEYVYNAELGIDYLHDETFGFELSAYYNLLSDAIVRTNYQLNGQDSLFYDGDMYQIITNSNAAKAIVAGLSAGIFANYDFAGTHKQILAFKATTNYNYGRNLTDDVPLGHISPLFGMVRITYTHQKIALDLYSHYQALKPLEDMSPYGEDNEDKATDKGFPAWYTVNFRMTYIPTEHIRLNISVENIFDQMYRPFASGVSAPGRNFILALHYGF